MQLTRQEGQVQDPPLVLDEVGDALAGDAPLLAALRSEVAEDEFSVLRQNRLRRKDNNWQLLLVLGSISKDKVECMFPLNLKGNLA